MSNGNNWCRHYNGIPEKVCEAGVSYESVQQPREPRGIDHPCYNPALRQFCAAFEPKTAEEIAERDAHVAQFIENLAKLDKGEIDTCPHCGATITAMKQVGRCVYLEPCGDRLWQGKIPKVWKDRKVSNE